MGRERLIAALREPASRLSRVIAADPPGPGPSNDDVAFLRAAFREAEAYFASHRQVSADVNRRKSS